MARRPAPTPASLRMAAIVMAIGALMIGIAAPVLLTILEITTVEIAPGIDLLLILLPLVGITDLVLARVFWQRAKAMEPDRGNPVVG